MSDTTAFPYTVPATALSRVQAAHKDQTEYQTHPLISFTKQVSARSFTDMRQAAGGRLVAGNVRAAFLKKKYLLASRRNAFENVRGNRCSSCASGTLFGRNARAKSDY